MILDANGQPIDLAALSEPQTAKVGHLQREFDDHPSRGLTPARLSTIMRAAEEGDILRQLELAEDMEERDGHMFAELDKRAGAVALLDWSIVEPENATPDEKKLTDQVREWFTAYDVDALMREMMSAVLRSFNCHEMTWSLEDGVMLPTITQRPHRWFGVDRQTRNQLRLRSLEVDTGGELGEPLAPFAWIAHVHKTRNGYLARGGLVRVLAWPYLFKNYSTRDLAEMLEIWGLPLRLGKYPSGSSDEEKRRLLQAVTQIGHNAAGIIPSGMTIDFQSAATGTDTPFKTMIDLMDAIESKVVLGQTLTSSEGKNGTQALGKVHNDVRLDIRDSDARQVERSITRQLIHPMCVINVAGADPRRLPRFQLATTEAEDLATFATALPPLVQIGLKVPLKWAQDKLRIPEPAEGEAVLMPAPPPPAPALPGQVVPAVGKPTDPKVELRAQLAARIAQPDALDHLVMDAASDWQQQLGPIVNPLLEELDRAIAAGEPIASFRARLPQLVTQMDYLPMALRQAQAAFVAKLAGTADLQLDLQD